MNKIEEIMEKNNELLMKLEEMFNTIIIKIDGIEKIKEKMEGNNIENTLSDALNTRFDYINGDIKDIKQILDNLSDKLKRVNVSEEELQNLKTGVSKNKKTIKEQNAFIVKLTKFVKKKIELIEEKITNN